MVTYLPEGVSEVWALGLIGNRRKAPQRSALGSLLAWPQRRPHLRQRAGAQWNFKIQLTFKSVMLPRCRLSLAKGRRSNVVPLRVACSLPFAIRTVDICVGARGPLPRADCGTAGQESGRRRGREGFAQLATLRKSSLDKLQTARPSVAFLV